MPVGEQRLDGRLPAAPGDQQARVPFQQQALVPRGEAAAGDHHRRLRKPVHDVQQARHQVMLAERRRDSEDVRDLDADLADQVLQAQSQLHVGQPHGAEQGGPGGSGHVADAQREAWQREVLRVIQRCQQDYGPGQPGDGLLIQLGQRQPRAGGRPALSGPRSRSARPGSCGVARTGRPLPTGRPGARCRARRRSSVPATRTRPAVPPRAVSRLWRSRCGSSSWVSSNGGRSIPAA